VRLSHLRRARGEDETGQKLRIRPESFAVHYSQARQAPVDLDPSPALSLVGKAKPTLKGRKIGALVTDGADGDRPDTLRDGLDKEGAELAIVAPKIGEFFSNQENICWATWRCRACPLFSLTPWRSLHRRGGQAAP
jgi:hypothetical protein